MIGVLLKQLTKNVSGLPGWVPLTVFGYVYVYTDPYLSTLSRDYKAVFVIVSAYVFYKLGDAIDKAIFKKLEPGFVAKPRKDARRELGIHDGVYSVSRALADAAGMYAFSGAQLSNETSKFLRSLFVPSLLVTIVNLVASEYIKAALYLCGAVVTAFFYAVLKGLQMKLLYENTLISAHCREKYSSHALDDRTVLFFWDGNFIGSGQKKPRPSKKASEIY